MTTINININQPPAVELEGGRVCPANVVRDDEPGRGGHREVPDHPEAGEDTEGGASPGAGLELCVVGPDHGDTAAHPDTTEEPQQHEQIEVLAQGGEEAGHRVDHHGVDQDRLPPESVAQRAPDVASDHHPHKEDGGEPTLPSRGELQVALGRGEEEGDAEDLHGVRGVGPAADEHEKVVEPAIAGPGQGSVVITASLGLLVIRALAVTGEEDPGLVMILAAVRTLRAAHHHAGSLLTAGHFTRKI